MKGPYDSLGFFVGEVPEDYDKSILSITCIENLCHWVHRLRQQQVLDGWEAKGQILKISDQTSGAPDTIAIVKPCVHPNGLPEMQYQYPTSDQELDDITIELVAMEIWEIYNKGAYKEIGYKGDSQLVLNCLEYLRKLGLL